MTPLRLAPAPLALLLASAPARALDPGVSVPGPLVDPADYPWQAQVDPAACAACTPEARAGRGVVAIVIPPALRSGADPLDGSDLALLDAEGRPLALAVARGEGPEQSVAVEVEPAGQADLWLLDVGPRPVDALALELPGGTWVARVQVEAPADGGWAPVGPPVLVWRTDQAAQLRAPVPALHGALRLRVEALHTTWGLRHLRVEGVLHEAPHVPDARWTVEVPAPRLREDGVATTVVTLPQPLAVTRLQPLVEEPVFERRAGVAAAPAATGVGPGLEPYLEPPALGEVLRRVQLGGAALDETTLPVAGPAAESLLLHVDSSGQVPLRIDRVELSMPGAALLVVDPGPGPWTLLAGAAPGTRATSDLQVALPELARQAGPAMVPGPRSDNPAWIPVEVGSGLGLPSTALDLAGLRFAWPVQGPAAGGLVRVPLPDALLADSRPDLGDLRLVTAEGRQVPYLLRRRPLDTRLEAELLPREEDGPVSRLRLRLPPLGEGEDGARVQVACLRTEVPRFRRRVTLLRVRGPELEPLRSYGWEGEARPTTLCLDVDAVVGRELVVEIDNGDDPPLRVDGVELWGPAWELVALLPPGEGTRLLHGDPARPPPDYDLALLAGEVGSRPLAEATLGDRAALEPPPVPLAERALLLAGLGVLVAGLGALVVGLLRAVPEAPAPEGPPPAPPAA